MELSAPCLEDFPCKGFLYFLKKYFPYISENRTF